jgi:hypothetical protein
MAETNELPAGFGAIDPDFQKKAYAESKKERSETGGVVFLKPGVTQARMLPPHKDAPSWFYHYKEHGLHPDGTFETLVCPAFLDGSDCPICDYGTELYATKDADNMNKAQRYRAKKAYLYNALIYSSPDGHSLKDGIKVIKSGVTVYKQLMEYDGDVAGGWGDITSLTAGWDVRIDRQGKGRDGTTYMVKPIPQRTDILAKLKSEELEIEPPADLTQVYAPRSLDEMKEVLKADEPPKEN